LPNSRQSESSGEPSGVDLTLTFPIYRGTQNPMMKFGEDDDVFLAEAAKRRTLLIGAETC
jgi:hypothetical protein